MGQGENVEVDRFEWLLSAQVTMGAGVRATDVPYLGSVCHLESRLVTEQWREHREQEPLNLDPFTSHSGAATAWDGITILALRLGLLKVSFKGINWMNKSV